MARSIPSIAWKTPPVSTRLTEIASRIYSPAPPQLRAIRRVLAWTKIPETMNAATPKDDAIGLLKMAAEVEHALLVRYLYASLSLPGSGAASILRVAIQEMGHLVSVQNLLLAIGGLSAAGLPAEYHLGRDSIRRASELNPLPLVFDAVSKSSLAEFVVVERPAFIDDPDLAKKVDALTKEAQAAAGTSIHAVSQLYATLFWLFQPSDAPVAPLQLTTAQGYRAGWHLQPSDFADAATIDRFATTAAEWAGTPGLIVSVAHNQAEACSLIGKIVAQGEGVLPAEDSHFRRFLTLVDQADAPGGLGPALPLPRSPFVDGNPNPEDAQSTPITHPYTVLWAKLFNSRYALLLLDIGWTLSLPRDDGRRAGMLSLLHTEMQVIKSLNTYLAASPLAGTGGAIAGPPFALANEQLPDTVNDYQSRYQTALGDSASVVAAIQARTEYQVCQGSDCTVTDFTGQLILEQISSIDTQRVPLIPG